MMDNKGISLEEQKLLRMHKTYPELFIQQRLGWKLWDRQIEVAHSVRDNKETFVQSGNAVGKTQLAAGLVIWWLLTRRGKVVTTAPTWRQVKDILWAKIGQMATQVSLGIDAMQTRIEIEKEWYATGLSTKVPDKFQGYHGNVLIVVDEACGVENEAIWTAIDGDLTDAKHDRLLAIGNPTNPDTPFARRCYRPSKQRKVIKISSYDTPNVKAGKEVIPGLVTKEWVDQKKEEWGENSPYFLARVLGEFPRNASESLFPLSWLDYAFNYSAEDMGDVSGGERVIGMDVSASGADNNAMCYRTGGKVQSIIGWPGIDTSELVRGDTRTNHPSLFDWIDNYMPDSVQIDAVGVGKPIYDTAKREKKANTRYRSIIIRPFIAQKKALKEEQFANAKAEAYWNVREMLRLGKLDLSNITGEMRDTIEAQANAIRWEPDNRGRVSIEKKERMRARTGFSPDELEAMIMSLYGYGSSKPDPSAYTRFEFNPRQDEDEDEQGQTAHFDYRDYNTRSYEFVR